MNRSLESLTLQEQLNFLITNRIPRRWLTQFMGWYSQIQNPLVVKASMAIWQFFSDDLRLDEAKKTQFNSLQDCFTRELKPGARPINEQSEFVTSPCDAIVGACGTIENGKVLQAKGFPYQINELIPDFHINKHYRHGKFITLRLKSSMYHRFHAPVNCEVTKVNYISGDTWNVNPITLKRVEKLFCKNERAIVELKTGYENSSITLVPVAAVLVACMKFNFLAKPLDLKYRGPNLIACHGKFKKGDEMGYFQHGSTIILFASKNYQFCEGIEEGTRVNVGQALFSGHPLPKTEPKTKPQPHAQAYSQPKLKFNRQNLNLSAQHEHQR